jgi:PAS domain S-box-containing protein
MSDQPDGIGRKWEWRGPALDGEGVHVCVGEQCNLAEIMPAAVFIASGPILDYVNAGAERLTGRNRAELAGMNFWEVFHPRHQKLVRERGLARLNGEPATPHYEAMILTKQGETRWADFSVRAIEYHGRTAILGVAFDITARKQAESDLRSTRKRFRDVMNVSRDSIYELNVEDKAFAYMSPAVESITGFSVKELMAMGAEGVTEQLHPEDRAPSCDYFKRVCGPAQGRSVEPYIEYRWKTKSGEYRWLRDYRAVMRDAAGKAVTIVGAIHDISEEKQLHEALEENERYSSVGRTMAGVAHHMKGILTRMLGSLSLMDHACGQQQDPNAAPVWGIFQRSAEDLSELVQDMLTLSIERAPKLSLDCINGLVKEVCEDAGRHARAHGVEFAVALDPGLPQILFDKRGLSEALDNLVDNAVEACCENGGGRVIVETGLNREKEIIEVVVSDNGPGIPDTEREKIFDPFFSTKGYKGNGLGLAISRKIIQEHGGDIHVRSEAGRTDFRVQMPMRK